MPEERNGNAEQTYGAVRNGDGMRCDGQAGMKLRRISLQEKALPSGPVNQGHTTAIEMGQL